MHPHLGLYIFRGTHPRVSTAELLGRLAREVATIAALRSVEQARRLAERALLHAGEIECLLADHRSPRVAEVAAIVDALADRALGVPAPLPSALPDLGADLPADVRPSPPEGFAYCAVGPDAFARLADTIDLPGGAAGVIGIRTIGLTLAASVAAALRRRGARVTRASARPTGHPYARSLAPDAALLAWMIAERDRGSELFVVDEGPGMSGSSFLAVAEALTRAGVDPRRVHLLGTRAPDPGLLLAEDAPRRLGALAGIRVAPETARPDDGAVDLSAGAWRARSYDGEAAWPAAWPAQERRKYLSADRRRLYKFEGLGRWGEAVCGRAAMVAEGGFGPSPTDAGDGFACYPVLPGRPLDRADRSASLLDHLARYCAFRASAGVAREAETAELEAMVRHDSEVLLGRAIEIELPVARPVIADARLEPHEWIAAPDGHISKVDAGAHGDDQLFPGPVDIAWDLAGAIAEWDLEGSARRAFLDRYALLSGDQAASRIEPYLVAYRVLGAARAAMAGATQQGAESVRWERERDRWIEAVSRGAA